MFGRFSAKFFIFEKHHTAPALAFAVGVFIGFSPAYGLHMLLVGFCAWAFGLNLIALLAGAFLE